MAFFYKTCTMARIPICRQCRSKYQAWIGASRVMTHSSHLICHRTCSDSAHKPRFNPISIQMLSQHLHEQIFKVDKRRKQKTPSSDDIEKSIEHLKEHGLWGKDVQTLPDVNFKLPKLYGRNIDEHFQILANKQSDKYMKLSEALAFGSLPTMPQEWAFTKGWTMYDGNGGRVDVDYPLEDAVVFDVECLMTEGLFPTLAVAASTEAWYSWCSERLVEEHLTLSPRITPDNLIPMETAASFRPSESTRWKERLIIGHNVSFDRSFIKEQYYLKGTKTRFLDTLSLHMAVSGLTTYQRALWMADRTGKGAKTQYLAKKALKKSAGPPSTEWLGASSPNNLADVYALYSRDNERLDKSKRDTFISGTMEDVRSDFQELMSYCAKDVEATHVVFTHLLPKFYERFPHPVTFAATLEMGQAYLPVNHNWERYLRESQETYDDLQQEMKLALMHLANDACQLMQDDSYKEDPWLWELDWSTEDYKLKKEVVRRKPRGNSKDLRENDRTPSSTSQDDGKMNHETERPDGEDERRTMGASQGGSETMAEEDGLTEEERLEQEAREERLRDVMETADRMPKIKQHMVGYPMWYRELCPRKIDEDWAPGPCLISSQVRVAPKLLRLTWEGYPLHYEAKHGWGYLVPGRTEDTMGEELKEEEGGDEENNMKEHFPLHALKSFVQDKIPEDNMSLPEMTSHFTELDSQASLVQSEVEDYWTHSEDESTSDENDRIPSPKPAVIPDPNGPSSGPERHGQRPRTDVKIPGCWFYRLPHKDGGSNKVGNPLAKDFLNKLEDGTLGSAGGAQATRILEINKLISFWRNASKRINSQMVVDLEKNHLPRTVTRNHDYDEDGFYGAIIPRVIAAGTVTRRAVEPTWLTASNARTDRVGSELKAMVQAPPGYHLVGADVDSQELWIAALLGDANFAGFHACTALGWMTLQGKKSDGTDMHSVTASTIGISREHAKIINYGRIYGAGRPFAVRLLMQFNHKMSLEEAREKANKMYAATKGLRMHKIEEKATEFLIKHKLLDNEDDRYISTAKLRQISKHIKPGKRSLLTNGKEWTKGSESAMFNQLESIAHADHPKTPVLKSSISRALEPKRVNNEFLTSRVNWVVQSSAVDYLHLMLVCMRWLFEQYHIDGRFCISIHDEVRYLVTSEDRYRAALALQITNLLTRCMFAYKMGMADLPQSVAFFSAVDIDTVLRKEVTMDCQTPSNPYGLQRGYGIPAGEALDVYHILEKSNNGCLTKSSSTGSSNSSSSSSSLKTAAKSSQ
ncbi:DNA polymerase subunit gamma-1-like [Patiria miniata]|uniref:DNA polymerase subunit gamma-1 n=1 Tax=Patiria miniata TaxID=46514 RepID=A0A914AV89_PATMI|nr:DNA polymerase subunit gamma-1-like [Patiria miniata]XP_038067404.1 DNA polymerase subunit gamma-1-like [Patiria miniata]XP_038067413.1 DNA polymerase subunit gamma-1-like [Patiria miniata]XP_038067422.1 DNA polymerase subunit gamma-1-like [Patiria miniata]